MQVREPSRILGGPFAAMLRREGPALRKPPKVVELPLSAWADGREDKPAAPIPIGLRLPSEDDVQRARDEASKAIEEFASRGDTDDRVSAYNDALVRELVASSACQAADVTKPFFEMASLDVRRRLTPDGVKRLYQEIEALRTGCDPAMPELDPEGLAHLTAMLDRDVWKDHLPYEEAKRIRRLLEHARQELFEAEQRAERAGVPLVESFQLAPVAPELPDDQALALAALERRRRNQ